MERLGVGENERLVGFNVGAGDGFAHKAWRTDGFAELARSIADELGARVLLLGGERERDRVAAILERAGDAVLSPGATSSLREFAAVVERCAVVVTGDTLGMHIALASRCKVLVLFGSTCAQEIEMYGRGEKIVPRVDCHPCYRQVCDLSSTCADSISVDEVLAAVRRLWEMRE
jgi:heptosyltransferase-2